MKILFKELSDDLGFSVAILGGLCSKVTAIVLQQYGTIFVLQQYGEDRVKEAQDHLSNLFLAGNLMSLVCALIAGHLSDRFRMLNLLNFLNLAIVGLTSTMVWQIQDSDISEIGFYYDFCFVMVMGF